MSHPVIKVENLSKQFVIAHESQEKYATLRDTLAKGIGGLFSRRSRTAGAKAQAAKEAFWAVKDVSFEINQGDRVGIIGRNGAGKSTLLKLLSRITEPSSGRITLNGRVASLLEVGTGFHPELTGRENIYLNGAILGMGRVEIRKKFDEIVAFAETEKFLDTPVKRYSSGMYVRLAFAIAAHLEPEILIVDEVLAVGDAQFQKKCLGKMEDVSKEGRTILFVSHQMGTISQLCDRAILLNKGTILSQGKTSDVIQQYLEADNRSVSNKYVCNVNADIQKGIFFETIHTVNAQQQQADEFSFKEQISVVCKIKVKNAVNNLKLGLTVQNLYGYYISTDIFEIDRELMNTGDSIEIMATLPHSIIAPNSYYFRMALFTDNEVFEVLENICGVRIIDTGTSLSKYEGINYGSVILETNWQLI